MRLIWKAKQPYIKYRIMQEDRPLSCIDTRYIGMKREGTDDIPHLLFLQGAISRFILKSTCE